MEIYRELDFHFFFFSHTKGRLLIVKKDIIYLIKGKTKLLEYELYNVVCWYLMLTTVCVGLLMIALPLLFRGIVALRPKYFR
jgi:predicted ABC-type exoprotein transport system permease subunit